MSLLSTVLDAGAKALERYLERRAQRQREAEAWAREPSRPRACKACREVAYVPGQVRCNKCGSML